MTRRLFNRSEKAALYIAADGKCQGCGADLTSGWHADHVTPHSKGGATDLSNGSALCAACNLMKGSKTIMADPDYADMFQPREFQSKLIDSVLNNHAAGKCLTVAIASPGSGKTLAYQAAATGLIRERVIDLVAVYAPRIALATQCELEYRDSNGDGHHLLFDPAARLESIVHRQNTPPLTSPGTSRTGFVTTYSSLVSKPGLHLDWARQHSGRFLLIGDEAQFLGAPDEDESEDPTGTKAGDFFRQMHEHSAHTILLTGTEKRSDNSELVLAAYETRDDGKRYLIPDVRARYSDGIGQGYLRPFEADLVDAQVTRVKADGEPDTDALSLNGEQLNQILRKQDVWQPIVDATVRKLRSAQADHRGYKALIACQQQGEARTVHRYLTSRGVEADLSVSEDGKGASDALERFKFNGADVLVTVRKAFLGYDCKAITAVGLLTNYRDQGHLEQLVGRGLRVWDERPAEGQWCRIVAPNDPAMMRFLQAMEEERDQGLDQRPTRPGGDGPGDPPRGPTTFVDDAYATSTVATGHAGYVDADNMTLIQQVHEEIPSSQRIPQADLLRIFNEVEGGRPMPEPPQRRERLTRNQLVSKYKSEAEKAVKAAASARVPYSPTNPGAWQREVTRLRNLLNDQLRAEHGLRNSKEVTDPDTAKWVRDLARSVADRQVAS